MRGEERRVTKKMAVSSSLSVNNMLYEVLSSLLPCQVPVFKVRIDVPSRYLFLGGLLLLQKTVGQWSLIGRAWLPLSSGGREKVGWNSE